MFRNIRRWVEKYKKFLLDSYEPPKPTIYKIGNRKYIKKKVLNRPKGQKGPYRK